MEIINNLLTIISMFLLIIILDYLWLGLILQDFIIEQFGSLVKVENQSIDIKLWIGLITWLIIAVGVFIFAVNPSSTIVEAVMMGALFGFIVYSVYDLTNLTFLKDYPIKFVFIDIVWGTVLCSILSTTGFIIKNSLPNIL